jgi:hypothetical protein
MSTSIRVPATEAAIRLRKTRERVIRSVQVGELEGALVDGRWVVDGDALERAVAAARTAARPGVVRVRATRAATK